MGGKTEKTNKLKSNRGPTLDSFLEEEGLKSELSAIVFQLQPAMRKKRITKVKLAELMHTSRTQIDRFLDPTTGCTDCGAGIAGGLDVIPQLLHGRA